MEDGVREAMVEAAKRSNASVVTDSFHEFKPYGVSGAVIIQESHFTIHTWPEHGYAAVDLFYCSNTVAVDIAVQTLDPAASNPVRFHAARHREPRAHLAFNAVHAPHQVPARYKEPYSGLAEPRR